MEKHEIIFAGRHPVMRDPRREKQRDHRRRYKRVFMKESGWARRLWNRMNRVRSSQAIRNAMASGDLDKIDLHVDFPKTSGWMTW